MSRVIVIYGSDGEPLAHRTQDLFTGDPIAVQLISDPSEPVEDGVEPWEPVAVLLIVSTGLLAVPGIAGRVARMVGKGLPVIPVVEDLTKFRFATLEHALPGAYARNAAGLEPDGGVALIDSVRGYLGLESFARDKNVFISYRRSDAEQAADELYDYLWTEKFRTFLDTKQLPAGALVQDEIKRAIAEMDFVLLLDSPDAAKSAWVEAEVLEALNQRIPICRVSLGPKIHVPYYQEAPRVDWDFADPARLEKVKRLVSRGIAARQSHEQRVLLVLAVSADTHAFRIETLERRLFRLVGPTKAVLVEAEQAAVSIERVHRLYKAYETYAPAEAILVTGEPVIPPVTREAVNWARGVHPLHAVILGELQALLRTVFS